MCEMVIIPARKGSKRLAGKNMKEFYGKPLIYWTIQHAMKLRDFGKFMSKEDIIVTSDWDELLVYANQFPVTTIKRPDELATDMANIYDVIKHVLRYRMEKHNISVMLLQPTSPLRTVEDIGECMDIAGDSCESLCTLTKYNTKQGEDMVRYKPNGAVYIIETQELKSGIPDYKRSFIMPPERSIDIDTEKDFRNAEDIFSELQSGK